MSLVEYKRKRNFRKTAEPSGTRKGRRGAKEKRFVIQKHDASRLHYDFRLELEGTLKSWAVPKGPSFDPKEKRLAVHVEDHPLDYATFEGTIPKGQYGGGTVMVWDEGTWESLDPNPRQSYAKGRMKFELHGKKLQGGWALIRMAPRDNDEGDNWLLIKEKDEFAQADEDVTQVMPDSAATGRSLEQIAAGKGAVWKSSRKSKAIPPEDQPKRKMRATKTVGLAKAVDPAAVEHAVKTSMPRQISPQLCTLVDSVPTGDEWLHEVKFDGYRIVALIKNGKTDLMSRNGKPWTSKFPGIANACDDIAEACVLDGEVVALREDGTTDFQSLQNFLGEGCRAPLAYYVFDLLYLNGFDLTKCTLRDRKQMLKDLLGDAQNGLIRFSEHIEGSGEKVYSNSCKLGLEGVVSKQADAAYMQKRTRSWVKTKCLKGQEFVIGGFTDPSGSRSAFGALLLGYYNAEGDFVYAGRVGTGFTEKSLRSVAKLMKPLIRKQSAFASPPIGALARGVHWLEPKLVCEVEFTEWTQEGQLRHPSFKGIRDDKKPVEITREVPRTATRLAKRASADIDEPQPAKPHKSPAPTRKGKNAPVTISGVTISNPGKKLYPEGITKQMLAEYYDRIADRMLPYLAGRPLSLVRCPDGRTGQCFYQKHISQGLPKSVRTIPIREKKGTEDYLMIEDKEGLLGLVNLGVLEFHTWGCHAPNVERPDMLVFDLDPGPDVTGQDLVNAAHLLRDHLKALGLKSFLKTTGGKGYHIAAPLEPNTSWDDLKAITQAIAAHMAEVEPEKYTATMSKAKRTGKIYIDYLRNSRGATFIAPYSTRARENAPISMPIDWEDFTAKTNPGGWTLLDKTPIERKDPWRELLSLKQTFAAGEGKPKLRRVKK
ncbi:MAG: DNA ligase D [Candidatus Hydrogenedentes bacterium]|nr:DNA ligase D [Candidatus Hydrogenedentota bacterium]